MDLLVLIDCEEDTPFLKASIFFHTLPYDLSFVLFSLAVDHFPTALPITSESEHGQF
jgi:hypothetical protein